jgi:hypothetical protein
MQFTQQHFDTIMQETAKNGGVSIKAFLPNGNIEKHLCNQGYIVSDNDYGLKTKTLDYETFYNHLKRFDYQFGDIGLTFFDYLNLQQFYFIGVWRYRGYYYVDLNTIVYGFKNALQKAIDNKQKAIYDCQNQKTIKIDKNTLFEVIAL